MVARETPKDYIHVLFFLVGSTFNLNLDVLDKIYLFLCLFYFSIFPLINFN